MIDYFSPNMDKKKTKQFFKYLCLAASKRNNNSYKEETGSSILKSKIRMLEEKNRILSGALDDLKKGFDLKKKSTPIMPCVEKEYAELKEQIDENNTKDQEREKRIKELEKKIENKLNIRSISDDNIKKISLKKPSEKVLSKISDVKVEDQNINEKTHNFEDTDFEKKMMDEKRRIELEEKIKKKLRSDKYGPLEEQLGSLEKTYSKLKRSKKFDSKDLEKIEKRIKRLRKRLDKLDI